MTFLSFFGPKRYPDASECGIEEGKVGVSERREEGARRTEGGKNGNERREGRSMGVRERSDGVNK